MMSPNQFLTLLEEKGLLSPRTAASLREQIAQSSEPVTAAALAKRLVKHGKLTASQAKRMLSEEAPKSSSAKPAAKSQVESPSDIGFAPVEGEQTAASADKSREKKEKEKSREKPKEKRDSSPKKSPVAPSRSRSRSSLLDEETAPQAAGPGGLGTLDGILSDNSMSGSVTGSPLTPAAKSGRGLWGLFAGKGKGKHAKKTEEEKWGGGLMLVGGGSLVVLILASGFLIYAMNYTGAEKMLDAANGEYRASSYANAIAKYNAFLDKFPTHAQASLAHVRIGLARMRQATSGTSMSSAMRVAEEEVQTMSQEKDFKEAHEELASMLSTIAEGLAADALKKPTPTLAEQTQKTLDMIEKYVPKDKRPENKLSDVRAKLAVVNRNLARGDKLDKAIAAMEKATKELKTADAYKACSVLLHDYPDLLGDAKLKKTLLDVSLAQQHLVKTVSKATPPAAAEAETAVLRSIAIAQSTTKTKLSDAEGQTVLATVDGVAYGLDAVTGRVIWRRIVGFDANPQAPSFPPTLLSPEAGSDALVVDNAHNELLRLEGPTGKVRWRFPVGEPFDAQPVITGDKILVATKSGKLFTIAAATGQSPSFVQFPQDLAVGPVVDSRRSLIYQVATHTNLFVLSAEDGACKHVAYLGHEPASITVPPVVVDDYLLVCINGGARDSTLKVFTVQPSSSDKPEPWLKLLQEIPLEGHLQMSPLVDGRRVLTAANSGVVRVFELTATDPKMPFREVAQVAIEEGEKVDVDITRFALMQNGQFWIADNRLTKYDVQAARGRLTSQWIDSPDCAYLQPPVAVGPAVVSVRRRAGMPGAIVSAIAMQNADHLWDTQLAAPLAGTPVALGADGKSDGRLVAVTANGGVFRVDTGQAGVTVASEPILASDPFRIKQPVNHVVQLAGGLLAITDGRDGESIGVFDPAAAVPMMRWPKLPSKIKLACSPAALGRGLVVPARDGQVFWIDPLSDKSAPELLAEPFQPRLEPGAKLDWTMPTVVNDTQVIIADGKMNIYLLGVQDQPKRHLAAIKQTAMAKPITAPIGVLGQTGFVVDSAGALTILELPSLSHGKETVLGGRCVWGPVRSGENVLLAGDDNNLHCFDAKGASVWGVRLEHGPLAGPPLRLGQHFLFASQNGVIWRADAATGKELAKVDTACPLGTGPVMCGPKLLVGGYDGTLYEVRQP